MFNEAPGNNPQSSEDSDRLGIERVPVSWERIRNENTDAIPINPESIHDSSNAVRDEQDGQEPLVADLQGNQSEVTQTRSDATESLIRIPEIIATGNVFNDSEAEGLSAARWGKDGS